MNKLADRAWEKFDSFNLERDDFELELQPNPAIVTGKHLHI